MHDEKPTVIVLGGYGNFGQRLCTILAQDSHLNVIIAGRDYQKAQQLVDSLKLKMPAANVSALQMDGYAHNFEQQLQESKATILVHTAGPFQGQDYKVAAACIQAKVHYLDLSDGREYVTHIQDLDEKAKLNEVVVISGASSVPGISSVVIEHYAEKFGILTEIDFGIAPANKIERGDALIKAILGYTGKPFSRLEHGKWKKVFGWQNIHRHYYGDNVGLRWHANCDIPDLDLLPQKHPTLKTVVFHAGLEVPFLHLGLWTMSWFPRMKLIGNWVTFYKPILAMSRWFKNLGTDTGGMYVRLAGSSLRYQPLEVKWTLVAEKGHGPFLPIVPCLILIKKIAQGLISPGAGPCYNLFTLAEFNEVVSQWSIYTTVEEKES